MLLSFLLLLKRERRLANLRAEAEPRTRCAPPDEDTTNDT